MRSRLKIKLQVQYRHTVSKRDEQNREPLNRHVLVGKLYMEDGITNQQGQDEQFSKYIYICGWIPTLYHMQKENSRQIILLNVKKQNFKTLKRTPPPKKKENPENNFFYNFGVGNYILNKTPSVQTKKKTIGKFEFNTIYAIHK